MNEQQRQIQRIKDNQKFLLKLLHLHIGNYYPLRRWLGIDYTGKIDEISHLSYGYDTQYFKKGTQWYKKQTRVYQQPDLGYKLNWILDSIPQAIIPKYGQPSWGLIQMRLARCNDATYQPTVRDTFMDAYGHWLPHGDQNYLSIGRGEIPIYKPLVDFDLSDLDVFICADATLSLYEFYYSSNSGTMTYQLSRLLRLNWGESTTTWDKYDGTNAWTGPGCESDGNDYTSTNSVYRVNFSTGWNNWTAAQNLIQDCWDAQSYHVQLVLKPYGDGRQYYSVYSRRETTNITLRPKLTVVFYTTVNDISTISMCAILKLPDAIDDITSLACSTQLEPNRWKKDTTHTQIWTKEPTHNKKYKS